MESVSLPVDDRTESPPVATCLLAVDGSGVVTRSSLGLLAGVREVVGRDLADLWTGRSGEELGGLLGALGDDEAQVSLGRHWLRGVDRPDILVDVVVDPTFADDTSERVLILRDVTAEFVEEQKRFGRDGDDLAPLTEVAMAVTRWTPERRLEYHSPEFASMVTAGRLAERPRLADLLAGRALDAWTAAFDGAAERPGVHEIDWETGDGREIRSRVHVERDGDGGISGFLVVSHDVTDERARYQELTHRALYDPLTGLANRATALEYMKRSLGRRDRTATSEVAIFVDLDHFKVVNDTLGHAAGDELLLGVARRLTTTLRPHDVVSRFGGDEFVVFLENMTGIEPVLVVVDRLHKNLSRPLLVEGHEVEVSVSMGVAFGLARDETAEALVDRADTAMYKAKAAGRNRFELYDDELRVAAEKRLHTERALRRAMHRGEMEVHFLPEFDLPTRSVIGAEALLRWRHPDAGLLPASEFIGLAEETGLLVKLGNEVLRRSCELVAGWLAKRDIEDFTLRVNISARQLTQPGLVALVEEVLDDTGLDPGVLCLELAESTVAGPLAERAKALETLRDRGVKIAIDDFGTAGSSLSMLKQLPVDMLKIDMSFVRGLGIDPRDDAIVDAVLRLAEALDMEVVAEGIDSDHQLCDLIERGCRRGQGYGLSRVVRPEELLRRYL